MAYIVMVSDMLVFAPVDPYFCGFELVLPVHRMTIHSPASLELSWDFLEQIMLSSESVGLCYDL